MRNLAARTRARVFNEQEMTGWQTLALCGGIVAGIGLLCGAGFLLL